MTKYQLGEIWNVSQAYFDAEAVGSAEDYIIKQNMAHLGSAVMVELINKGPIVIEIKETKDKVPYNSHDHPSISEVYINHTMQALPLEEYMSIPFEKLVKQEVNRILDTHNQHQQELADFCKSLIRSKESLRDVDFREMLMERLENLLEELGYEQD